MLNLRHPIIIPMEDEIIHTAHHPVCDDATCPCHVELFNMPHPQEPKRVVMTFPDERRRQVVRELMEENELPY